MSHRALDAAAEVALSEGRAGQPEGRSRDAPLLHLVQVEAGLPPKNRADVELAVRGPQHLPSTDDMLVHDERLHQPSSGDLPTRAPSSFVAGSRAVWRSQDTDEDYPVPG